MGSRLGIRHLPNSYRDRHCWFALWRWSHHIHTNDWSQHVSLKYNCQLHPGIPPHLGAPYRLLDLPARPNRRRRLRRDHHSQFPGNRPLGHSGSSGPPKWHRHRQPDKYPPNRHQCHRHTGTVDHPSSLHGSRAHRDEKKAVGFDFQIALME